MTHTNPTQWDKRKSSQEQRGDYFPADRPQTNMTTPNITAPPNTEDEPEMMQTSILGEQAHTRMHVKIETHDFDNT